MSGSLSSYRPTVVEAKQVFSLLCSALKGQCRQAGSLYRNWCYEEENVGDVDVVLVETEEEKEENDKLLTALFGRYKNGNPRTMGVLGRVQVDLFRCTPGDAGAVSLFYCLPRPLQLAMRCMATVRGYRFGPKGLVQFADNPLNDSKEERKLECESMWQVCELLGASTFSREELRKAALYVYKEDLNKPR